MPYCSICDKPIRKSEEYIDAFGGLCSDCYQSLPRCFICDEKEVEEHMVEIEDLGEDINVLVCWDCYDALIDRWREMIDKLRIDRKKEVM
jgi:hypothetical protein